MAPSWPLRAAAIIGVVPSRAARSRSAFWCSANSLQVQRLQRINLVVRRRIPRRRHPVQSRTVHIRTLLDQLRS